MPAARAPLPFGCRGVAGNIFGSGFSVVRLGHAEQHDRAGRRSAPEVAGCGLHPRDRDRPGLAWSGARPDRTAVSPQHQPMSMPAVEWPEAEQRIAEVARTKRGRHRNAALASYRRTRALELRAQGKGYAEIAREVGYANKGTAHKVIAEALEARESYDVDFLRQVESDRLNAMHAALWPAAMAGDVEAVRAILRISDARCRVLGLYELLPGRRAKDPKERNNCWGPQTVVINPKDCRWDGCDRHGKFDGDAASPRAEAAAVDRKLKGPRAGFREAVNGRARV